ncbi:MAG: recombinase family protein [Acidimicrobiia bacterium]
MRVAGYIRELPSASTAEPAFSQWERIRRWVAERGELLVAVCSDDVSPRTGDRVGGLRALLALLDAGAADAVVIASVAVLGADPADQELALWELRRRGGVVLSTDPEDGAALAGEDGTGDRKAMRRLLEAADDRRRLLEGP